MNEKQKLTLSVDKETIEKAKNLGLNISEIAENALKSCAFKPTNVNDEKTLEKYKELFRSMLPLLQKFHASVEIGKYISYTKDESGKWKGDQYLDIILTKAGEIYSSEIDDYDDPESGVISRIDDLQFPKTPDTGARYNPFYPPQWILSKFIKSLSEAADRQKATIRELEVTKKIIDAISSSIPTEQMSKPKKRYYKPLSDLSRNR